MESPDTPSIDPSEPEKEQQLLEHIKQMIREEDTIKVVGLGVIRDELIDMGLDIDKNGFLINIGTGEHATPYCYDADLFTEISSPVDDPVSTYSRPEPDVNAIVPFKTYQKIHLSDLHSLYKIDGEYRPIRDNSMVLRELLADTGMVIPTITEWSDTMPLYEEMEATRIHTGDYGGDSPLNLSCLKCDYRGNYEKWEGEDESPECPNCGGKWDCYGLEICTKCGSTHWFRDLTPDDGNNKYWEPYCPTCNAGCNDLESKDRY